MSVRIIIADDHRILRDGLKAFFTTEGITVIGEAENGVDAVNLARRLRPEVVVIDLSMPRMNGIEAAAEIRQELGIPAILLTMHTQENYVVRAFSAGIAGYVLKSKAAIELVQAVHEVSRGNAYLSPGISRTVIREMLSKGTPALEPLTVRERQVLQLIAEGNTTKEIAEHLGVSVRTGESHRSKIMEKLNIHQTAGLVRYAIRQGLIEP